MNSKKAIIKGTFILTATGVVTRLIGFYYRIFLSNQIGAEQLGIYQLIFPLLVLVFSVTASGIQMVISRQVAAGACGGNSPKQILGAGLCISLFLSFCASYFLYKYAEPLAVFFLKEERCAPLLKAASFCIPLSGIHMCAEGYYYGLRKTTVPAAASFTEQIVRVLSVWLLCQIAIQEGRNLSVDLAIYGLILGECASVLVCLTALSFDKKTKPFFSFSCAKSVFLSIFRQGIPLTANKVLLNLLQSLEAVLIPARLQLSGLTSAESLAVYGVLTGMAMPFVLFPSTLTNSASAMLLPTVAEAQAAHQNRTLQKTAQYTLKCCLLLGIFCTGIFVTFGSEIGICVFHNEMAGRFLRILGWICPLLYLSSTFGSIIHGLGRTGLVFFISLSTLGLRIAFILFLVPEYGILAYLWGMLLTHLITALLYVFLLNRLAGLRFSVVTCILKPAAAAIVSCEMGYWMLYAMQSTTALLPLAITLMLVGILYTGLLAVTGCFADFKPAVR